MSQGADMDNHEESKYAYYGGGVPQAQAAARDLNLTIYAQVSGWRGTFDYYEVHPDGAVVQTDGK